MFQTTQGNKKATTIASTVSVVASMAAHMNVNIEAPSAHITKASAAVEVSQECNTKLSQMQDMKKQICSLVASDGGKPEGSIHVVPEADKSFGPMSFLKDLGVTGIGFALGGPAGAAVAGAVSAVKGGASMFSGFSFSGNQKGHFGLSGVEGGELNEPVNYTDALGGEWKPNGQPVVKVAQNIGPAMPSPLPQQEIEKLTKGQMAARAAEEMFGRQELVKSIFSVSKEEKELLVVRDSLTERMDNAGLGDLVNKGDAPQVLVNNKPKINAPAFA